MRARLRRRRLDSKAPEERKLTFPGLEADPLRRQVLVGGETTELTARELEVLALLTSNPGRVYSRDQIMNHLWGGQFFGEPRSADVHIQHISQIEPDPRNPRYIQTLRGMGYRFAET